MWSLLSIKSENIAAFRELDYSLTPGVTTLVFGENKDNDSQGSNGSGKSALLEVISIALTGETLRKIKIEEIINDACDEAFVEAVFSNNFTKETFKVSRYLSRKSPQKIACEIRDENGELIKQDETSQSGVSEYNKYILEKIGLTRDDIFGNFILSKHKYSSFLSSSDKDKKEIINRFSNAIIVDEAIEALNADLAPVSERFRQAELAVSKIEGSITAVEEQIVEAKDAETNKEHSKEQRKIQLNESIENQNQTITSARKSIRSEKERIEVLNKVYNRIVSCEEDKDASLSESYRAVLSLFSKNDISGFENWEEKSKSISDSLSVLETELEAVDKEVLSESDKVEKAKIELAELKSNLEKLDADNAKENEKLENQLKKLNNNLLKTEAELKELQETKRKLTLDINNLNNRIAGEIVCPKCSHVFVLDKTVDVQAVKSQIIDLENEKEKLGMTFDSFEMAISQIEKDKEQNSKSKRKLSASIIEETQKIEVQSKAFNALNNNLQRLNDKSDTISGKIKKAEDSFDELFDKMFDSAYLIVDQATKSVEQTVLSYSTSIKTAEGTIETYRKAIEDLEIIDDSDSLISRLEKSLAEYEEKSGKAISEKQTIEKELDTLKLQEQRFIEFKTHLANSKIDALSLMTNEFLEGIGSDIRIRFSGYTVLKSGKIRDKISISLIRNGIDCGSFDKFSEGEKARVNLANILAMHKLTNVNCGEGKGLDLLVLDEILEATDESGLSNIFEALNSLRITSLVVSHGNIAENYPHRLVVNKQNGVSFLNQ